MDFGAVNNYYPFGMLMPDMSWQSSGYRYGYNGMEMDNDIKGTGNHLSTHFRGLDPRVGRWGSTDPKENLYPSLSSYNSFGNNPIVYKDSEGDVLQVGGDDLQLSLSDLKLLAPEQYRNQVKLIENSNVVTFEGFDNLPEDVQSYEGISLLNDLITSKKNYEYVLGGKIEGIQASSGDRVYFDDRNAELYPSTAITNLSVTDRVNIKLFPNESSSNDKPRFGIDGAVRISDGEFSITGSDLKVPRGNVIFHELKENFYRTELQMYYHNHKDGISGGAHKEAGKSGEKFSKEVGNNQNVSNGEGEGLKFEKRKENKWN